ncbi:hypothetical protein BDV95DRAFT_494075 [Massariosphaeria phaeospora]|uniref:SUR7/PalI family-domain-containing protein n=1 Tax=Massariosphaeria phaeospora TaxID=100035 RepID=A0A7C8I987_9PLEO|nr:hypothetical protein BDV95DRAFT_494075 [Massariosphaeria phaeospora]
MALRNVPTPSWLAIFLNICLARASFWTHTYRLQESLATSTWSYGSTYVDEMTYTETRTMSPKVTPTETPTSAFTSPGLYQDLDLVYEYYAPSAVAESDLVPDSTYDLDATTTLSSSSVYTLIVFLMPVTYTAPASCPTQFTFSTDESVDVPTEVTDQLTPATVVTDTPLSHQTYIDAAYETWHLTAGAAPFTTTSQYAYSEYISACKTPYSSSSSDSDDDGDDADHSSNALRFCSWYSGCTSPRTWIIIIAAILPSLFVLGFVESWFWFRRLMTGRGCLRFGTVTWIMISLWVACFTRTQSARSVEDQKLLRERWNALSASQAFKLWWKWGFRHRYPIELLGQYSRNTVGVVPEGQPLPQMGQMGPGMGGPPPPGAGYAYPPPQGQPYLPPQGQAQGYYGAETKEPPIVTTNASLVPASVSPIVATHSSPVPAPVSPISVTPPNIAQVPTPPPVKLN